MNKLNGKHAQGRGAWGHVPCGVALLTAGWLALACPGPARAGDLEQAELAELRAYLVTLEAGQPSVARKVEQFLDVSFTGLREVMVRYGQLDGQVERQTHVAFQALLAPLARQATDPSDLIELYSPELAAWLSAAHEAGGPADRLFQQLMASGLARTPYDLAVALCPAATLDFLAHGELRSGAGAEATELYSAWNRRLNAGPETRTIHQLDRYLSTIAGRFTYELQPALRQAMLTFLARWPQLRDTFAGVLRQGLTSDDSAVVLTALEAQRAQPILLELNEAIVARFPDQVQVRNEAIGNFAHDSAHDHAPVLRRLWKQLPADDVRSRYFCLYAMGVHPQGCGQVALEAIESGEFSYMEPALNVLEFADETLVKQAVSFVLNQRPRGHEEAFRLARQRHLPGFEDSAVAILQSDEDLIVKVAALHYLQQAPGAVRLKLLNMLEIKDDDLRLAAIQMYRDAAKLDAQQKQTIGPALMHVFLNDPSFGHRAEALFTLACWKDANARPIFEKVRQENTAQTIHGTLLDPATYWAYRFRLVALLGLAKLEDAAALEELKRMHVEGGPQQRMDVLLAFTELGVVPESAFEDLDSSELKLIATAARLIQRHGSAAQKQRLHDHFAGRPYWERFAEVGLSDYDILRYAGVTRGVVQEVEHE